MSETAQLAGQVALVTGASRGIGRAIARALGALGMKVALNYRGDEAAAREAYDEVVAAGAPEAMLCRANVADSGAAHTMVQEVMATLGPIELLVNNAGIQRSVLAQKMSDEDWREVMGVNLDGPFFLARAVLPSMLERRSGQIIMVASASSFMGQRGAAAYVTSKHGLIGLTRALAVETAGRGVRVNAVAPGLTQTDLLGGMQPEQLERLVSIVPMRRLGQVEEVAEMVRFVACGATYSTGNIFHVGGGVVMA